MLNSCLAQVTIYGEAYLVIQESGLSYSGSIKTLSNTYGILYCKFCGKNGDNSVSISSIIVLVVLLRVEEGENES